MKTQLKNLCLGLAVCAMPFVATATASAQQTTGAETEVYVEGQRSHAVTLNRLGQVEGRITTGTQGEELNVYFVRDGKVVTQTRTQDGGYFVADSIEEGNYSFIATGNGGFTAYGVQVRPYDQTTTINAIEAATVSSRIKGLERIIRNSMPSQIAAEIDGGLDFTADGAEFAGSNIVRLNDGQLNGQVASVESSRQSVGGTEVFIIRNNREMARTTADRSGRFTVRGLEPGVYDFIAAGSNGIAAVRFQATDGESVLDQNNQDNSIVPVSFRKPVAVASAAALQVCLTCGEDAGVVNEQINYSAENAVVVDSVPYDATPIEYASESVGCGCAVGGSCGSCGSFSGAGVAGMGAVGGGYGGIGGGFGGGGFVGGGRLLGGGGFGRLISLGGLAGGIVALADDEGTVVIPASPSNASN